MGATVLIVSNTAWNIYNFRRGLIREFQRRGFTVVAVAPSDEYVSRISETGARFIPVQMDNKGTNPIRDIGLLWSLWQILRRERPLCVLTFTPKPNIYGAFAARALRIPIVTNISGLGTVFIKRTWVTSVVRALYRRSQGHAAKTFFQNQDDLDYFVAERLVDPRKTQLVPGSGVDTTRFVPAPYAPMSTGGFRFLLFGRLLWDKGVGEYVDAARHLRERYPNCEFLLMGFTGAKNATAIPIERIEQWQREGLVRYLPPAGDVRPHIASADCVVLPSYREGTPKSLLEAASMGKPVIAADVPGCRQVVDDGVTGYLARVRDPRDLARRMEQVLLLSDSNRQAMGLLGRDKMIREFDERFVVERYMETVLNLVSHTR